MLLEVAMRSPANKVLGDKIHKHLLSVRSQTKRFIFDEDASHRLGYFAIHHTDLVCQYALSPKQPFPYTYIETDNRAGMLSSGRGTAPDAAPRVGFLFTPNAGRCYVLSGDDSFAFFSPYFLTTATDPPNWKRFVADFNVEEPDLMGMTLGDKLKYVLMVGEVFESLTPNVVEFSQAYRNAYGIGLTRHDLPDSMLRRMIGEGAGQYKRAMTGLMLLEDRVRPKYQHVAGTSKLVGSKQLAVPEHDVVTIDIDNDRIRKLYDGTIGHHASPALHDVSSHWLTYDLSAQCKHVWVPYTSKEGERRDLADHGYVLTRQVCTLCGGRRTRRPNYQKGDPSKPKKIKTYKVIASKGKKRAK